MQNLKHHWHENIKPLIKIFIFGFVASGGIITANWAIPAKPIEYRICVQEAGGDYACEVYR